ncbi:MAG: hypothetical protein WCZ65_04925 [Lysobacteraceae bacterium]
MKQAVTLSMLLAVALVPSAFATQAEGKRGSEIDPFLPTLIQDAPRPTGQALKLGETATTRRDDCPAVARPEGTRYVYAQYQWAWSPTRDSDGDGKLDAEPDWKMTGFSADLLETPC